jgi:hypothetical protein
LELCGLPSYDKNEGSSLVSVMQGKENTERYAITTFGMNNHAVRSDHFRFIQYEDGLQELYDHREDPFEWTNEASNNKYQITRELLADELPVKNEKWNMHSQYTFQPYFVEQKKRTSGEE